MNLKMIKLILSLLILAFSCGNDERNASQSPKSEASNESPGTKSFRSNESQGDFHSDTSDSVSSMSIKNIEYNLKEIPYDIEYKGSITASASWIDKSGKNILLITETDLTSPRDETDTREKELYAYQYVINESQTNPVWKVYDYIKDCPVDVTLEYIEKSLSVTDLDNDGIGESTFIYRLSCKGDVSSDDMKLIMHEGNSKYAIRGTMELELNNEIFEKGSMKVDKSFDRAPEEFKDYAIVQWNKFMKMKLN